MRDAHRECYRRGRAERSSPFDIGPELRNVTAGPNRASLRVLSTDGISRLSSFFIRWSLSIHYNWKTRRNERASPVADPNSSKEEEDGYSTTSSRLFRGTLHDLDRLSRGEITENPVQWVCNNSVLLLGMRENGWEIRMAIGIRPPSGNVASVESEANEGQ